jgi:protein transport protein SEC24
MLVISDPNEPFVPLPEDLLVNLEDSKSCIENLLSRLPKIFASTQAVDSALGNALKVTFDITANIGAKILVFTSSLPNTGMGKLKLRDDPRLYGTDKEVSLLTPEDK